MARYLDELVAPNNWTQPMTKRPKYLINGAMKYMTSNINEQL